MKKLAQNAVTTTPGTRLYTVPPFNRAEISVIDVCNTTSGSLTLALHFVPSGSSASTSNMVFPTITVDANSMVQWTGPQGLNAGDYIQAIGSAAGITINITGDEVRIG